MGAGCRYGRCLGSSGRGKKELNMGKWHLKYFSGCGVFYKCECPVCYYTENVKLEELSLQEPKLQHSFVHRPCCDYLIIQ